MNKLSYILSILIITANTSCKLSEQMIPDSISQSQTLDSKESIKNEVDKIANKLIKSKYNIGLVVAVLHNNETNIYTYGYADKSKKNLMNENTVIGIGSNTKVLVNSLGLILEAKGIIDFDETIGDILPKSIEYKDEDVRNITLRELTLHTSGLPREPGDRKTKKAMLRYAFAGKNIYDHIDTEYMYNYLSRIKINKQNIEGATYSNIGSGLLAHLFTLKTNKSLNELLKKYLFEPLHMENTTLTLPKNNKYLATGYAGDFPPLMKKNRPLKNWQWSDIMIGTGGGYSTAKDLIEITKAHLSLSNTSLDSILRKSHETHTYEDEVFYTMAWQVKKIKKYNTIIHYKYGVIAGFSSYVGMNTKTNDAIIVLKNNFNWKDDIGHNILLKLGTNK